MWDGGWFVVSFPRTEREQGKDGYGRGTLCRPRESVMEECLSSAGPEACRGEVFARGVCNPWSAPTVISARKQGDHFLFVVISVAS